jgi:hypothetical protein
MFAANVGFELPLKKRTSSAGIKAWSILPPVRNSIGFHNSILH